MNVFLLCCLAAAGGVGKSGVLIGCGHVCAGTFPCVDVWQSAAVVFWLMVLLLMTFDGLGRGIGHVLDLLGHGVGGVIVFSILQGGLSVGIGVH